MNVAVAESPKFGSADRVEWHLENWGRWMRSGRAVSGYPHRACGCTSWGDGWDDETKIRAAERSSAQAVNAIIAGLSLNERLAVDHQYLHAVYRFRDLVFGASLASAKDKVGAGLRKRGIW